MTAQQNFGFVEDTNPGAALRAKWLADANTHPLTIPLAALAKRAWREHWPDPATAGVFLCDVAELSRHLKQLEAQVAMLGGAQ